MNVFYAEAGESVWHAVNRVLGLIDKSAYTTGQLTINDIRLTISYDSNPVDIGIIYNLKHYLKGES